MSEAGRGTALEETGARLGEMLRRALAARLVQRIADRIADDRRTADGRGMQARAGADTAASRSGRDRDAASAGIGLADRPLDRQPDWPLVIGRQGGVGFRKERGDIR